MNLQSSSSPILQFLYARPPFMKAQELSTSMFSGRSHRNLRSETAPPVESSSLQRAIDRLKLPERVSYVGISSVSQPRIPKQQSFFIQKLQCHSSRIKHPSQEPSMKALREEEQPKQFTLLKKYCNSQKALELSAQRFRLKKDSQTTSKLLESFGVSAPKLMDRMCKKLLKKDEQVIRNVIKEEVKKRIPRRKTEINYEMDSLFKNYKELFEKYNQHSETKQYNVYNKLYTQSMKESIYLSKKEREKSASDESVAYQDFLNQLDQEDIQRDVYNSALRNPFLDDKITVKSMKKDGLLRRRFAYS